MLKVSSSRLKTPHLKIPNSDTSQNQPAVINFVYYLLTSLTALFQTTSESRKVFIKKFDKWRICIDTCQDIVNLAKLLLVTTAALL